MLLLGLTPFLRSGLGGSLQPCSPGNALSLRRFLSGDETTTYSPRHHPILGNEGGHRSYASSSPEAMQSVHSNPPRNQVVEDCITEAALVNPALSSRRRIRNVSRTFRKRAVSVQPWIFSRAFFSRETWPSRRRSALRPCFGGNPARSRQKEHGRPGGEACCASREGGNMLRFVVLARMTFSRERGKHAKVQSGGTGCQNSNGTRTARPDTPGHCECLRRDLSA